MLLFFGGRIGKSPSNDYGKQYFEHFCMLRELWARRKKSYNVNMSNIHLVNSPIMCVLIVLSLHYPSSSHTNKHVVDDVLTKFLFFNTLRIDLKLVHTKSVHTATFKRDQLQPSLTKNSHD